MSLGFGGMARLAMQDENILIYEYAAYNLNEEECRNPDRIYDGIITICRDALVEPEIHEKLKKMPSGRKKNIIKRIRVDVDYDSLFKNGKIIVENSKYCWKVLDHGQGIAAMKLLYIIFNRYQIEGEIPETVSAHY